jgi:PKD repeat protein
VAVGTSTVTPIDTATNTAGTPIPVGPEFGEPGGAIAITPDQAPVAHLSVTPAVVGQPTRFDASASTVAVGTITTYAWRFGDGSTAITSTPTTAHTYTTPGPYTATVTETDSAGTSTTQVFTGQTMSRNGGPSAEATQTFAVVPPLVITTTQLPTGAVWSRTNKVAYSATLTATGGTPPYHWSLVAGSAPLPPGLRLHRSSGVISGKATTPGIYSFTVQVVDMKIRGTKGHPATQDTATAQLSITIS